MTQTIDEFEPLRFVYLGVRIEDIKLSIGLAPELYTNEDGQEIENWSWIQDLHSRWWGGTKILKAFKHYSPGDVISIEAKYENGTWTIVASSARYVGRLGQGEFEHIDAEERILEWTMVDRAARTEHKRRSLKKDRDALREALTPVRAIYLRQVGTNRTAMLAEILKEIGAY
jgi:hypothetical protein